MREGVYDFGLMNSNREIMQQLQKRSNFKCISNECMSVSWIFSIRLSLFTFFVLNWNLFSFLMKINWTFARISEKKYARKLPGRVGPKTIWRVIITRFKVCKYCFEWHLTNFLRLQIAMESLNKELWQNCCLTLVESVSMTIHNYRYISKQLTRCKGKQN